MQLVAMEAQPCKSQSALATEGVDVEGTESEPKRFSTGGVEKLGLLLKRLLCVGRERTC